MSWYKKTDGFSLVELVLIICILGLLLSMAFLTFQNKKTEKKEDLLKENLAEVRLALKNYYIDHKHFPCSNEDFNRKGDVEVFMKQLIWYTNRQGEPSIKRSRDFRFGPYLELFPTEPITKHQNVFVDTSSVLDLIELKKHVAESNKANGGWYYQSENGFFIAHLNKFLFKDYYAYF
jgi:type II secretory pathway pseudopilin PulG